MKRKLLFCMAITTIFIFSYSINATGSQVNNAEVYKAELVKYLNLSGGDYSFKMIIKQFISISAPNLSEEKKQEITKKAMNQLITDIIPVYKKTFHYLI